MNSQPPADDAHLRDWIGRQDTAGDLITARLVQGLHATFDEDAAMPAAGEAAPAGVHWCLAPPVELCPDVFSEEGQQEGFSDQRSVSW